MRKVVLVDYKTRSENEKNREMLLGRKLKPYRKPKLECHGMVKDVTLGASKEFIAGESGDAGAYQRNRI